MIDGVVGDARGEGEDQEVGRFAVVEGERGSSAVRDRSVQDDLDSLRVAVVEAAGLDYGRSNMATQAWTMPRVLGRSQVAPSTVRDVWGNEVRATQDVLTQR